MIGQARSGALCAVGSAELLLAETVGVAFEREDLGVVDEAVDYRDGGDLVAEDLAPGRERLLLVTISEARS